MDRRNFIKTFLSVPLTASFLKTSPSFPHKDLFIIADDPRLFLPQLLHSLVPPRPSLSFAFSNPHPHAESLSLLLENSGWIRLNDPSAADISFSSSFLSIPCRPSFTLIQNGKIRDIRSRKALSLWHRMASVPLSSLLTTVSLRQRSSRIRGRLVTVHVAGRPAERHPLRRNLARTVPARHGDLVLRIESGRAWVSESSCAHKVCRSHPPISLSGERIVCAPNRVLIQVSSPGSIDTSIG